MKYIIKFTKGREKYLNEILKQIPELIIVEDKIKDHRETFVRSMREAGMDAAVHLEDDIILCDNFKQKIEQEISKRPDDVIQFFSMRKKDLTIGSRYEIASNYLMNQCFYLPKGYSHELSNFIIYQNQKRVEEYKSGIDLMVRDYLIKKKVKYYIVVPNLVEHAIEKSMIDKRRSSKRQSKTWVKQ